MALIVNINATNQNGVQVLAAVNQIRAGLGTLQELNGLRAESIAAGQATMAANFGVASDAQAQALNDRWGDLMNMIFNPGDPNYDNYVTLRDLLNAVTYQP